MSQGNIEALIRFFEHIKCSSPMFPSKSGGVVSVSRNAKLPEAFEKLIKNRILAIPVVSESGEAVSVFSMLDLVDHLVNTFSEEELKHLNSKKTFDLFFHYTELKEKKVELLSEKVGQILEKELKDIATLDPVFAIEDGKYVIDAIKIMVHSNAHRVVVYNPTDGQLTGIVTQSRVLEFLGTMLECIPDVNTMIKDLSMGTKEVVTIHEDKMAISAFKLMKERRVSGIAVVDSAGVIVGNVSANDLKLVGYDLSYFDYLARSVREYLSWVNGVELAQTPKTSIRSQMLLKHQTEKKNPRDTLVISCTPDNTLGFVIKTLNFYRVHRIYIVDHDNKPTGIISLHDIITFIFKNRL